MNAAAVLGLISRRGSIVTWEHATPMTGDDIDPASRQPRLAAAGPRIAMGPTGESYGTPYLVRAYISSKVSSLSYQMTGMQDVRDAKIDVYACFAPEPDNGIVLPDAKTLADYNAGKFCVYPRNSPDALDLALLARDRFTFQNIRYIVKSAAVPIQDNNITLAWRIFVSAQTF